MTIFLGYIVVFCGSLALGWVANVLAQRLPIENRPLFGPLHCVRSGEVLRWYDSLPLFGYFLQRGYCRHCHKKLPWRFPLTEGLIFVSLMVAWPVYIANNISAWAYLITAFDIALLITIGMIDLRLRLIFPVMIYFGVVVEIVAVLAISGNQNVADRLPDNLISLIFGALVGAGFFLLIYWLSLAIYRIRALGFGDVLLALLIGAQVGFPRVVSALFLGSLIAGVVAFLIFLSRRRKRNDFIPYGTWMCAGAVLVLMFGSAVWQFGPLQVLAGLFDLTFKIIYEWVNNAFRP